MNLLEKAFDLGFEKYLKNYYFCINETDVPTYQKPKQTVDRILVSRKRNIAIELKKSKRKLIPFSRFKDHQIQELVEFQQKAGKGYFLVSLNEFNTIIMINITSFNIFRQNLKKKSFNEHDITTIDHIPINAKKLRTNYRLDLQFLIPTQKKVLTSLEKDWSSPEEDEAWQDL